MRVSPPRRFVVVSDPPADDVAAIARSIEDPGAFRIIVDRHGDRMYGYLAARVGADAAEDLACDLWEQAFHARRRFDSAEGTVVGWLYGMARPLVLKHRRWVQRGERAHARAARATLSVVEPPDDAVIDAADSERRAAAVLRSFEHLSEADRDLLELAVWEDLSNAEIAQVLGISANAVGSRLTRARQRLAAGARQRWTS